MHVTFSYWRVVGYFLVGLLGATAVNAQVPVDVQIGRIESGGRLSNNGNGFLTRYMGECLVVTLHHVAAQAAEKVEVDDIFANNPIWGSGAVQYVKNNRRDDIYVGRLDLGSPLAAACESTEELGKLNSQYEQVLGRLISTEFREFELRLPPDSVALVAEGERTLIDAKNMEPIRYRLGTCSAVNGDACGPPVQTYSGSLLSMNTAKGEKLWLGMHQGACGDECSDRDQVWQAISVMQIFDFFNSKNFPIKPELKREATDVSSIDQRALELETLILDAQSELTRLRCQPGKVDGIWGRASINAAQRFAAAFEYEGNVTSPTPELLIALRQQTGRECPIICGQGESLVNGTCQVNQTSSNAPPPPRKQPRDITAENKGGCIRINGQLACP